MPDLYRSFKSGEIPQIRNPHSIRPWQHVLDCLGGYVLVAEAHMQKVTSFPNSFNFGAKESRNVDYVVSKFLENLEYRVKPKYVSPEFDESKVLKLDSTLAYNVLNWENTFSIDNCLDNTAKIYLNIYNSSKVEESIIKTIDIYLEKLNAM